MSRHISPGYFYNLPSGNKVHPCRLIHKDGTLMWKHALLFNNEATIPTDQAHEAHIIKTAQRLEELNTWVSNHLDPWEFLKPVLWYHPEVEKFSQGISVCFEHTCLAVDEVYNILKDHVNESENLKKTDKYLCFQRC